jgi:hypothetical protein
MEHRNLGHRSAIAYSGQAWKNSLVTQSQFNNLQAVKQKPDPGRKAVSPRRARVFIAVTLLLTLIAGGISLPAAASGPLCTLACCTGRAPHAVGSCMNGSCDVGASRHDTASSHQAHHHHEQQAAEQSEQSSVFPGAVASAGGAEMGEVPTIEALPYDSATDASDRADSTEPTSNRSSSLAMSAIVITKPCHPDCGACASGFGATKRSRNSVMLRDCNRPLRPPVVKLPGDRQPLTRTRSALGRQTVPRGPPFFFSC